MTLKAQSLALVSMLVLVLLVIKIEGNSTPEQVHEKGTNDSSTLKEKDENQVLECAGRPFICSRGEFPPRSMCCGGRCVDVTSDMNNCGLCGIRCRFTTRCCNRLCLNTDLNIFNCGKCGRVCPVGRLCIFGLCAFEQSVPGVPPVPGVPLVPVVPISPMYPPEKKSPQTLHYQPQYPEQPPEMD